MRSQRCLVDGCEAEFTVIVAEYPWLMCDKHKRGHTIMCPRYETETEKEIADDYP